jgi:DNA polymerase-3 subunit epsilon
MLIFVYDTETTGLMRGNNYTSLDISFLASIAALLYDSELNRIVSSFNAMVKPEGWSMPEEAGKINGLTDEYLNSVGIPASVVIPTVIALSNKADLRVAHNADFDDNIIAANIWREIIKDGHSKSTAQGIVEQWLAIPTYCTMRNSKEIVGALDKRGRIKYPKLIEAYKFFFNKDLDRAHSANADAVATLEIYLALKKQEV